MHELNESIETVKLYSSHSSYIFISEVSIKISIKIYIFQTAKQKLLDFNSTSVATNPLLSFLCNDISTHPISMVNLSQFWQATSTGDHS